jgi:hypothetical protein
VKRARFKKWQAVSTNKAVVSDSTLGIGDSSLMFHVEHKGIQFLP